MPTLRELIIKAVFKSDKAQADVKKFDKKVDDAGKSMKRASKQASGLASNLKSMLLGFATFGGLVSFTKGVIATNAQAQSLAATMKTLAGGNEEVAKANIAMVEQFAVSTPFALTEITEAFIKFKAAGIDPTLENLKKAGDFAAATGTNISLAADAITKAKTNKFAQVTSELKVSVEQLGDSVKLTFGKKGEPGFISEIVKKGPAVSQALLDMGAKFPSGMANQLDTLGGKFSNLGDATFAFRKRVGEAGFNEALTELLSLFIEVTGESTTLADAVGQTLAAGTRALTRAIRFLMANFEAILPVLKVFGALIAAKAYKVGAGLVIQLAGAFNVLKVSALKANAAALIWPAIIGIVALLVQDLIGFVDGADSFIGRLLAKLGVSGKETADIASFIRDTVNELITVAKAVLPTLIKAGSAILKALLEILPALGEIIGLVALAIAQLAPLVLPLIELLVTTILEVIREILPAVLELVRALLPIVIGLVRFLVPILKNIIVTINFLVVVVSAILKAIFTAFTFWVEKIGGFVGGVIDDFKADVKNVGDFVTGIISGVAEFFSDIWGKFASTFPRIAGIIKSVVNGIKAIFTGLKNFIVNGIKAILGPIWEAIGGINEAIEVARVTEADKRKQDARVKRREEALVASGKALLTRAAAGDKEAEAELRRRDESQTPAERAAQRVDIGRVNIPTGEGSSISIDLSGAKSIADAQAMLRKGMIERGLAVRNATEEEKKLIVATQKRRFELIEKGVSVGRGTESVAERKLIDFRAAAVGRGRKGATEQNFTFSQQGITVNLNAPLNAGPDEVEAAVQIGNKKSMEKINRELAREARRAAGE